MTKFKTLFFIIIFYCTIFHFLGDLNAGSTANNQKFYIEDISIHGNTKTKENVISQTIPDCLYVNHLDIRFLVKKTKLIKSIFLTVFF